MFSKSLKATFLIQALLAISPVFAIPSGKERFAARRARRSSDGTDVTRQSKPVNLITSQIVTNSHLNISHEQLSSNWAGAVLVADTATYTSVTGTFIVPEPTNTGDTEEQCAAAWVGIDGDTCAGAILQTGLDFCAEDFLSLVSYTAWYEFFPAVSDDFPPITISAGDSVTLTATILSPTSGFLEIINNDQGTSVSTSVVSPSSSSSLCQFNAEWIVEDFTLCDGDDCELYPFVDFGTVEFTGAQATTVTGEKVTPGGTGSTLAIFDIEQGTILTASEVNGSTVTIEYVGAVSDS